MSLWKIAWRSIQQRALASALTAFSMGLGVSLVAAVLVIYGVIDQSFKKGAQGYDLLVGAKGSDVTLVLGTIFHLNLNQRIDSLPWNYYENFTASGRFAPAVELAVPVAIGHDYKGWPAIATTSAMLGKLRYLDDRKYEFAVGRNFKDEKPFEAVVGATAARRAGLKVGDKIKPVAPSEINAEHTHEDFEVVGVLAPTGTPNDRAIFINIEGYYQCPAHQGGPTMAERLMGEKKPATPNPSPSKGEGKEALTPNPSASKGEGSEETLTPSPSPKEGEGSKLTPNSPKEGEGSDADHDHAECDHDHELCDHDHDHANERRRVTAILVRFDDNQRFLAMQLDGMINRESDAMAVFPVRVITDLFNNIIGNIQWVLLVLAVLVVVVAGIGILVSIYNSMSDRKHEIAVMRALGASRLTVMAIILLESILLSLGGGAVGVLLGHGLIAALGPTIAANTGVSVSALSFQIQELFLIPGLIVLATAVGFLPAAVAYRTDVAKSLQAAA